MLNYIDGRWIDTENKIEVLNPYNGAVVDTVPEAGPDEAERALASAVRGAKEMAKVSAYERFEILNRVADLMAEEEEEFSSTIALEVGKTLAEAKSEVSRAIETMTLSAEEAKRIQGETIPYDAASTGKRRFGFTVRVPCGVVLAITPFNYPLNLVCHKLGPALAAGNAIIVKPASDTPLSALKLINVVLRAGVPREAVQCLTGPGGSLGQMLCADKRVRKVSFTGSRDVGEKIAKTAGLKKVTMELGSNSPLIIMPDADMEKVAETVSATGYANTGQSCISTQRVMVCGDGYEPFLDALKSRVEALTTGDPMSEETDVGTLIREKAAVRVEGWVNEAVEGGARLVLGGRREGAIYLPSILADVKDDMQVSCDELFGPAVAVSQAEGIDEAIARANDSNFGLSAGIFTENIEWAMKFAQEMESGNLHINWSPTWRVDLMPYGGLKESGFGKEGPKYAVEEMSESKTVVFHMAGA